MLLGRVLLFANSLALVLATEDRIACGNGRALLEASGDAVLSVFVDVNYGPYCNLSSTEGYEEVSTALFVIQTLNKLDYVPGLYLGLKIFDSCRDEILVYKRSLEAAVELDCTKHYDMGVLAPSVYGTVLEPLRNFSVLPISIYKEENLTKSLINVMVHYLSTRFEAIDLVLAGTDFALNHFLDATKEAGLCVKSYKDIFELEDNVTEAVIAVIGDDIDIRQWVDKGEKIEGPRKTWIVLPLHGSFIDDLVPPGSYVIKTEPFDFDVLQEYSTPEDFLQTSVNSVIHSPHLVGIGKAIVELAQVLQDLQKRSCPNDATTCVMPRFNPHLRQEMRISEVYEALHILPKSHSIKYIVAMRNQKEFVEVAGYRLETTKFRVVPEQKVPKMPRLCLRKYSKNCARCANFQRRFDYLGITRGTAEDALLKTGVWIPIFLTVAVCGTFASLVIMIFIVYRFFSEEVLDGNPALTIVLILANVFTLQAVLPFCMNDYYIGPENLNSRKIFVTTLAFGVVFSVMLSRSLFLAFSTGGVFTTHISGYLQGLMVFFMSGVQIAISTMYFALSTADSSIVVRSLTFIALLAYDIFLLTALFIVCCFIAQIQRNYREGKCFFGTVIGLLIVWAVWVTCFILMEPETRDTVVSFGIIATSYLIIIGILIPRTYYMVTHLAREKSFARRYDSTDLAPDLRTNTLARQCRPFYDYVHPGTRGSTSNLQIPSLYPNYYGNSSPNSRHGGRCRSPDPRRMPGYNNLGFRSEMREIENPYVIPRVRIENADSCGNLTERSNADTTYAKPRCNRKQVVLEEKDCIETDMYVEDRPSPSRRRREEIYPSRCISPRLEQTEATICEEDESSNVTRITRF